MKYNRPNLDTLERRYPGLLAALVAAGATWDGDILEFDREAFMGHVARFEAVPVMPCAGCGSPHPWDGQPRTPDEIEASLG